MNKRKEKERKIKKRRRRIALFLMICAVLLFTWWFNNYTLKINSFEIKSGKLETPVRIAVIADLHANPNGIDNDTILKKLKKAEPDAVFMLGDMYTRKSPVEIMQIPVNLTAMIVQDICPVYFVTGDHDTDKNYLDAISKTGAEVMNYRCDDFLINGNKFRIMGIDNVYYSPTFDLHSEFETDPAVFNILMAHIPNYDKFADFGADLTLCADTHGGMIQLPFGLGPVIDSSTMKYLPEVFGDETVYDKGFFDYDGGTMFITSGIGDSPYPVRFNNRPEIVVIDIVPE